MCSLGGGFLLAFLLASAFALSSCIIGVATTAVTGVTVAGDKRSLGSVVDDKVIVTKIIHGLIKNGTENSLSNISVNVCEGRVLLTGCVIDIEFKDQAEKVAWLVRGVKEVMNDVVVTEKNIANTAKDSWLTTQLKAKFLVAKGVHSVNYQITSYNNVVYLLGIAENQEELNKALKIAGEIRGASKVKNYVVVKNDTRRNDNRH